MKQLQSSHFLFQLLTIFNSVLLNVCNRGGTICQAQQIPWWDYSNHFQKFQLTELLQRTDSLESTRNSKTSLKIQYPCSTDRFLLQNRETFLIKWLLDSRASVDVCILRRRETCGWPLKRPTHENSSNWALRRRRTGLCSCHHKLHPSSPTVIAIDFHPEGWSTRGETSLKITSIHDTEEKKTEEKRRRCISEDVRLWNWCLQMSQNVAFILFYIFLFFGRLESWRVNEIKERYTICLMWNELQIKMKYEMVFNCYFKN